MALLIWETASPTLPPMIWSLSKNRGTLLGLSGRFPSRGAQWQVACSRIYGPEPGQGSLSGACVLGPLVGEGRTPPEHTSRVRGPHVWRAQAREPQGHREEAGWLSLTSHHAFCRWELRAKHWLWNPVWVHISVLPLVSSVTFSKTLFLSEPQFPI